MIKSFVTDLFSLVGIVVITCLLTGQMPDTQLVSINTVNRPDLLYACQIINIALITLHFGIGCGVGR